MHIPMAVCMKRPAKRRIWGAGYGNRTRLDGVAREALFDIAGRRRCTVDDLLTEIDRERRGVSFATATRGCKRRSENPSLKRPGSPVAPE
jgi:predicted DNA-binding ribbon-helix-helix protein